MASDVQQIEYYLTPATGANAANGQGGGVLTRAVTRDLLDATASQTAASEEHILTGVQALQVQFYDGSNWQDSWQYTSPDPTRRQRLSRQHGPDCHGHGRQRHGAGGGARGRVARARRPQRPGGGAHRNPRAVDDPALQRAHAQPFAFMKPPSDHRFPELRRRRGSVLIVVLVVCLGLVSMTLVFSHAMLLAYRGADNELAGRQGGSGD